MATLAPLQARRGMGGFYQGVEAAWPLRTHKHSSQQEREELSVRMREAARKYVELQAALRAGDTTDASMLAAYRSAMDDDEVAVAKLVRKAAEKKKEAELLAAHPAPAPAVLAAPPPVPRGTTAGRRRRGAGEDGEVGGEAGAGRLRWSPRRSRNPVSPGESRGGVEVFMLIRFTHSSKSSIGKGNYDEY